MKTILAVETSCDETAAAVVDDGVNILSNVVFSQIKDHNKYGGVVPEIASRKHIESIIRVIRSALEEAKLTLNQIEALAVTQGPGLIGSLLVGVSAAKAIAYVKRIPLIPVDHLEGHIYASFLSRPDLNFPFICLVVSGGHTDLYLVKGHGQYRLLGQTRDDAAGEAFDKVAKILGLGYPGGPVIDELAREGDPNSIKFPRAFIEKGSLDFSFSGLKTSVFNYLRFEHGHSKKPADYQSGLCSVAASFQEAIVDVLVSKSIDALDQTGVKTLTIGGGVASNQRLRKRLTKACEERDMLLVIPPAHLCVDNACMIGTAGFFNQKRLTRQWSMSAKDSRILNPAKETRTG